MGKFSEYDRYDALGLAELIRKGEVTPAELVEEAIDRIESLNPKVNAVIHRMYDRARKAAGSKPAEGPFAGVPFLIKDLLTAFAGEPLRMGCQGLYSFVPPVDSELTRRYKATGAIILGKTNTPEFGLMAVTEPELFGPTRNPWDLSRTPGGSSGGSAAAVACGMVPMAGGGDGGGSIRIPASHCGLFGLKPTRGRTPTGPFFGEIWQGAAVEHVLTRSVRDSAAMLDAVCAPEQGAPYIIQRPERPYLEEVSRDPGSLLIAFSTRSPLGSDVHPECVQAVIQAARLLEDLGHRVEEASPVIDGMALARCFFTMYYAEVASDMELIGNMIGRRLTRHDVEGPTWLLNQIGKATPSTESVLAKRQWNAFARETARFHERYDLYLTPTTASLPVFIGELAPRGVEAAAMRVVNALGLGRLVKATGIAEKIAMESLAKTPFTQLANLTGQPAMSVPLHWSREGLPVGVQFMARLGDEATLFRLAGQLEQAKPWFDRRPKA